MKYKSRTTNRYNINSYVILTSNHVMFSAFEMVDKDGVSKSIFEEKDGKPICSLCYTKVYVKHQNPNGRDIMYNIENGVQHRKSRVDYKSKKIMWTCSVPHNITPVKKVKHIGHFTPQDDGGLWIEGVKV